MTATAKRSYQRSELDDITDPRLRLLVAGAEVLIHQGCHMLVAGLSPEAVTTAAGRSRRVFYDHFESKEDFVRALLERNLEVSLDDDFGPGTENDITELLLSAGGNLFASVRALSALTHQRVVESESRAVRLVAVAMGCEDTDLRDSVARYQRNAERAAATLIENIFEFWGLQLRDPWTPEVFARVLLAISEGLYLRSRGDTEAVPEELVLLTMLTLFPSAILPAGAPMVTVEQNLREIADTLSTSWQERADPHELDNAYERVLSAFRAEVEERGVHHVTTGSVATRSGVAPAIVVRTFGDITGLLQAAITENLRDLQSEVEFDLSTDVLAIDEALRRHLLRLCAWVVEHRQMARAVTSMASATPGANPAMDLQRDVIDALAMPAITIFETGVQRGIVRAELLPRRLANTATQLIISGATNFLCDPTEHVEAIIDLLMNGCKTE